MMSGGYDEKVPTHLKREQQWFGSIISVPIDEDSRISPITPSGQPIEKEAALHISSSPTLRPAQRIQIYNQQYWWRLLNSLQESFPLLTRLFGYHDFNQAIGIPYLAKYPPRHWSLSLLGDRLAQWIEEEYHAKDRELIHQSALLEWAFTASFLARHSPHLELQHQSETLSERPLWLQPHIHLFNFSWDLFQYRTEFLKEEPEYWLDHDFPPLNGGHRYLFVLYRNANQDISWKEAAPAEYLLLQQFAKGTSIDQACEWLESQESGVIEEASEHLQQWFQEWTVRGWLTSFDEC